MNKPSMTEQEALLVLNAVPGLGNARIRLLLGKFGSAQKVLSMRDDKHFKSLRIPVSVVGQILQFDQEAFLKKELKLIEQYNVQVITHEDACFPEPLREIPDSPVLLYCKGNIERLSGAAVAVVGSRKSSVYGISMADQLASRLAEVGVHIISGMARGIDTAAHKGCLRSQGTTIAVLGSGLANVYPSENKKLAEDISRCGVVVSEFAMETPPRANNFPRRNRIISGLSLGVVVVEAAKRSGALITCNFALEQGREVFALPGMANSPNAKGSNQLIKEGAKLVMCVEDILEELSVPLSLHVSSQRIEDADHCLIKLTASEEDVFSAIQNKPIYIDELLVCCNRTLTSVMNILLKLELKQLIKQLPGKYFVRA